MVAFSTLWKCCSAELVDPEQGGVLHYLLAAYFCFKQLVAMHIVQKFSGVQCCVMRFACTYSSGSSNGRFCEVIGTRVLADSTSYLLAYKLLLWTHTSCSPTVHLIRHCAGRLLLAARLLLDPSSLMPSLASVTLSSFLRSAKFKVMSRLISHQKQLKINSEPCVISSVQSPLCPILVLSR